MLFINFLQNFARLSGSRLRISLWIARRIARNMNRLRIPLMVFANFLKILSVLDFTTYQGSLLHNIKTHFFRINFRMRKPNYPKDTAGQSFFTYLFYSKHSIYYMSNEVGGGGNFNTQMRAVWHFDLRNHTLRFTNFLHDVKLDQI